MPSARTDEDIACDESRLSGTDVLLTLGEIVPPFSREPRYLRMLLDASGDSGAAARNSRGNAATPSILSIASPTEISGSYSCSRIFVVYAVVSNPMPPSFKHLWLSVRT